MRQIATAPHECEGNLIFTEHGLSPYWILGRLLIQRFDGYSGEIDTEVDGEEWTINLKYQKSGIAPRLEDDVASERLYEYRISGYGQGERKANFLIQSRFANMRHYETGDQVSTPFDNLPEDEGVNVRFAGSNLEPLEFRRLLPTFVQVLAREGSLPINTDYFAGEVHGMSNITTYERYVRLNRSWSPKVVGRAGIMQRLMHLCATEKGSKFEYRVDNEDIVGYNHRVRLPTPDAKRLISGHRFGKQIKHYHPKYVREDDETDPLYHPKVGVLLKKKLNSNRSFRWEDHRKLRREIDETLINVLSWSGVPVQVDQTTYVPDDHFDAVASEKPVELFADPTPELETEQNAMILQTFVGLRESDEKVLKTLVTDGGEQHPNELADNTGRSISTVYRTLDRLRGVLRNDNACVSFASKKFEQDITAIVEQVEFGIENAADRVSKLYNLETKSASSNAWQQFCTKYSASLVGVADEEDTTLRIDTILSKLKSSSNPRVQDILAEAVDAWSSIGRDPLELRAANVQWRSDPDSWEYGKVNPTLR
ncbi:hypothetical protein CP556_05560 [Natrinema sp. CBA1119]|uniref:DUF7845 domain-containing protein n=1 Tax=Natrinema sp. CBA1119 TaxID=1608465 RepID=UPI000C00A250|nr:hypothetical protein [Natrinema sp. CBA1119]PGF15639.1 hypothetical protein CP556_05560 [Natrinema sp. CBA1119]